MVRYNFASQSFASKYLATVGIYQLQKRALPADGVHCIRVLILTHWTWPERFPSPYYKSMIKKDFNHITFL